jgi:hypothetical protein
MSDGLTEACYLVQQAYLGSGLELGFGSAPFNRRRPELVEGLRAHRPERN